MTLIAGIRLIPADEPADYWRETDRRLAVCRHHDRQVASAMNADNYLIDREPFGNRPEVTSG